MKILHLSDLHLGKRLNEVSLIEDQKHILQQVLSVVDAQMPDAVILAGDLYDRSVPPVEAVTLLDDFLVALAQRKTPMLAISGNHDSPERVSFGSRLMQAGGVHFAPVYDGAVQPVTLYDAHGPVDFFLLPFVRPAHVRRFFPEENISTFNDAVRCAIFHMPVDPARRSVLVAHQFVTGAQTCDSEELSLGGMENVDADAFAPFDYVALGHIHGPQRVTAEHIRYCGSPLKYSFSEVNHKKSVVIAELAQKGSLSVQLVPLAPLRDLKEIRGTLAQLTDEAFYRFLDCEAYIHATLTDEEMLPDAVGALRRVYPNLLKLTIDNRRTAENRAVGMAESAAQRTPAELFAELYEKQNNQPMTHEQRMYVDALLAALEEEQR